MNEPEIEITIEHFRGRWYGECLINWNDGNEPKYRLIDASTEQKVRQTCERIRWFVLTTAELPEPQIDWFAENPLFV